MENLTPDQITSRLQEDPKLALAFIINNNPDAVYSNLINENIFVENDIESMYKLMVSILDKGERALAIRVLNVPVIEANIPEGYEEAASELDLYQNTDDAPPMQAGPENTNNGSPSQEDINALGSGYTGNGAVNSGGTWNWGGFYKMTSDIVVGLWGSPTSKYDANNPYGKSSSGGILIAVGAIVLIVVLVLVLKKK